MLCFFEQEFSVPPVLAPASGRGESSFQLPLCSTITGVRSHAISPSTLGCGRAHKSARGADSPGCQRRSIDVDGIYSTLLG